MTTPIEADVESIYPALFDTFADLHRHPEVGFTERRTTDVVVRRLGELGIEAHRAEGVTGAVGVLRNGDGPVIAARADIDALPIAERTGLGYSSEHERPLGDAPAMHACGHDIHTTALLGTAELLARHRDRWRGTLIVIAQPAEELGEGARRFIASGVLDAVPRPDLVIGQHVGGGADGAPFTSHPGAYEAGQRNWRITAHGQGGHAAGPHRVVNPLGFIAQLVGRLQAVPAVSVDAAERVVLVPTALHGGSGSNIIPTEASATFCARALSAAALDVLDGEVERIAAGLARAEGIDDLTVTRFNEFPVNVNDAQTLRRAAAALDAEFGQGAFAETGAILGSEDFGEFATHWGVPSAYWHFDGGTSPDAADAEAARRGHSPTFAPDPAVALRRGVRALTAVLRDRLASDQDDTDPSPKGSGS